jgi:hypothetical protein
MTKNVSLNIYYSFKYFFIKLTNWEYWPIGIVYSFVGFYYIYLSILSKSFFFFSGSNPGIENGGMFFESKWDIYESMPKQYCPKTILIQPNEN